MPLRISCSFRDCLVDEATREVRRAGALQPVAPRVFDALIYLIRHAGRVVSKDELIEQVWNGAVVSESVVARAIMQARQAIGDDRHDAPLIKTVHRVGYRFVGQIISRAATPSAAATWEVAEQPVHAPDSAMDSVALLPIDNLTADAGLEWVVLGLLSVTQRALEASGRVAVAPIAAVLGALDGVADSATPAQRKVIVGRRLQTHWIFHASVTRDGQFFKLHYAGRHRDGHEQRGVAQSASLETLGIRFAEAIQAALAAGSPVESRPALDPIVPMLVARADEAVASERLERAVALSRALIELLPSAFDIERLRTLGRLLDGESRRDDVSPDAADEEERYHRRLAQASLLLEEIRQLVGPAAGGTPRLREA